MAKEEHNVVFLKNDLDNIELKDKDGNDLEGFIRHTEYYRTDLYGFTLRVDEEEIKATKRVFLFLRAKKHLKKYLKELTAYAQEFFKDAEVIASGEKRSDNLYTIDLFLYE